MVTENLLVKLFEYNNWANLQTIQACAALSDEQLDAEPQSVTAGTIRFTLEHLVSSQESYLSYLSGREYRSNWQTPPTFDELVNSAKLTGQELLALVSDPNRLPATRILTRDEYWVEPWILVVQAIQHGTEHREQLSNMLNALGVTPPQMDGWYYGEAINAVIPPAIRT